jgi:hypothetical protein
MCDVPNGTTQRNLPLTMFIGLQIGVATQLKSKATPFVAIVHYMAHYRSLTMQTFFAQPLVGKLERLL